VLDFVEVCVAVLDFVEVWVTVELWAAGYVVASEALTDWSSVEA